MGKRKFRLTAPKSWERKKYAKKEEAAMAMEVSIPLPLLNTSDSEQLPRLHAELSSQHLPEEWILLPLGESLRLCRFGTGLTVLMSVAVNPSMTCAVSVCSVPLREDHPILQSCPAEITSAADLCTIMTSLNNGNVCVGNNDEQYTPLIEARGGSFFNPKGTRVGYYDHDHKTIRHINCQLILCGKPKSGRCQQCQRYRDNSLRRLSNRLSQNKENSDPTDPASHANYRFLTASQQQVRLKKLHDSLRSTNRALRQLQDRVSRLIQRQGVKVDSDLNQDLLSIMNRHSDSVAIEHNSDSFPTIFWKQQKHAASLNNIRSMRWHPLIIKWCLYLHHRSSGAYEALRQSGVLHLPSGRTLRDYRHIAPPVTGFAATTDEQLLDLAKQTKPTWLSKYLVLLIDEMHVKEGLVFNKHTGALVGFSDLSEVTNHLVDYERQMNLEAAIQQRPLAKSVVVFMVRGALTSLQCPYGVFPVSSVKGCDLFPLMWDAIERLTRNGFRVLAVTADGAKCNRRLFKMHQPGKDMVYKVTNIFSKEQHPIYFISDPSHLIKTIRNCFASPKRHMWCNGQDISWQFIRELYHRNTGSFSETPGLSLLPKLRYEHVHLNSFSKMRVDLAAEVLSERVSQALYLTAGSGAFETAYFVSKVDKFFDCLNVSSPDQGKRKRKVFQQPYRSASDFRLKFLKDDFLRYLQQWEKSVAEREGFSNEEKQRMLISMETLHGIRLTVSSFLELVPLILKLPGAHMFLSEKLSQDPLEKLFGCIRQHGRVNTNPTVAEVLKTTQTLRVINTVWLDDITGNCRGRKRKFLECEDAGPLKKRKRIRRPSK